MEETKRKPDYQKELVGIIGSKISPLALRQSLSGYHDSDIAQILGELSPQSRARLFRTLDAPSISGILEYVEDKGPYLDSLPLKKKVEILAEMEEDAAADYIKGLDRSERNLILDLMDEDTRRQIALLVSFDETEVGSEMSTNFVKVRKDVTVKEAMRSLIAQASENDNISTLYVVDENDRFYGAIDLKDLIIAREGSQLDSIITTSYPYVYAEDQIEDIIEPLKEYSEDSIPVLDGSNRLLGVITAQNMVGLVDDQLGEDYARLGGLVAEEDLNEPMRLSLKKRLPWLLVLLGLGMVVSYVAGLFEVVFSHLTLIVAFQSLILGMAGNAGTQSLAVTIRVLTDENLDAKAKRRMMGKETAVGAINGLILCLISTVIVGVYILLAKSKPVGFSFAVSSCIGASLFISMLISGLAGTAVPIFFKKLRIDPAVASGPLITTINDLVAVVAYYGLAWLMLMKVLGLGS